MGLEMALTILITGANGFVGHHLAAFLETAGHRVVRASRTALPQEHAVQIDSLDESTPWAEHLQGVDVVVHLAARVHVLHESACDPISEFRKVNVKALRHLASESGCAGVKRFIFMSTIGVLGNHSDIPFKETDEPKPENSYSISKWEGEQALQSICDATGLTYTIIRPPLIYGPGVKANFLRLMECIYRQHPAPFKSIDNQRDFISIGNLCEFILRVMSHEAARNQTYLVSDVQAISTPDLIYKLADIMQKKPRLVPVPTGLLRVGAKLLNKERFYHSVCSSLRIETAKARQQLGWQPSQSLDEGLKQTVEGFLTAKAAARGRQNLNSKDTKTICPVSVT